jgi:4-hydroxy-tetrahydrodipicolinate reductase
MIRTVITGASGRMGSTLLRLVRDSQELELVGSIGRQDDLDQALEAGQAQVVIDFTSPEASVAYARTCARRGVAMVIGSTGFSPQARAEVASCATSIPIVLAPNTSVGVNVVFRMAAELARILGDGYDVEVLEAHHRMKKDAPSGTALKLAEVLAEALGRGQEDITFARHGQIGPRPRREIGVQTLRGGDVVGEHTVFFYGEGERIELTHRATHRDQFGVGALRAARWVAGRAPGFYDMADVLGFQRNT